MADVWCCIASGASLTSEDCKLIERSGIPTIAVNTSWKMARFCHALYAGDAAWWRSYGHEVDIPAERWCADRDYASSNGMGYLRPGADYNSGQGAIELAMQKGARSIILLGYDCSLDAGIHWHGSHDKTGNPDAKRVGIWHNQFRITASKAEQVGVRVINASRHTALDCFETMTL